MTTEVLRNMIYAGPARSTASRCVVLDEVHYLQDAYRGPVWEEVIIHLPRRRAPGVPVGHGVERRRAGRLDLARCAGPTATVIEDRASGRARQPLPASATGVDRELLLLPDARRRPAQPRGRPLRRRPTPRPARRPAGGRAGAGSRPGGSRSSTACADDDLLPGDLLHLQPRRAATTRSDACLDAGRAADHGRRAAPHPGDRRATTSTHLTDDDLDVLGYDRGSPASRRASPPTTPAWCRRSRRRSRPASPRAWSRSCSPPRRWRSASTCRPASVVIEKLTQVHRRAPRVPHARAVHPAHRPGRPAGHRPGRPRRRAVVAVRRLRPRSPALAASRAFALTLGVPADLQHGRQPRAPLRRPTRPTTCSTCPSPSTRPTTSVVRLETRLGGASRGARAELEAEARCERGDVDEYRRLLASRASRRRARPAGAKDVEDALSRLKPGDVIRVERRPGRGAVGGLPQGRVDQAAGGQPGRPHCLHLGADDFDEPPDRLASLKLPVPFDAEQQRVHPPDRPTALRRVRPASTDLTAGIAGRAKPASQGRRRRTRIRSPTARTARRTCGPRPQADRIRREIDDLERRIAESHRLGGPRFDRVLGLLDGGATSTAGR